MLGKEKLCQWEGSYMPSSSVSVFVRGVEREVQLKSDSYILYYVHTGNSFTAIL